MAAYIDDALTHLRRASRQPASPPPGEVPRHGFDVMSHVDAVEPVAREVPVDIPVLLRVTRSDWRADTHGVTVHAQLGSIVSASVREDALDALSDDPSVVSIEASIFPAHTECAVSMPWVGVGPVHDAGGTFGERGDSCIVAIIDDGIDLFHEAFRDGDNTRILAIWDQTHSAPGRTPAEVDPTVHTSQHGVLHLECDINAYLRADATAHNLSRNPGIQAGDGGHGTHVASIAAGSAFTDGSESFPGGVAPDARIVVVIPTSDYVFGRPRSLGFSASHVNAIGFIAEIAKKEGLPVVINLSQGQNIGAHDGSTNLESAFDELTTNGREPGMVIVKSAGNEREKRSHSEVRVAEGQPTVIGWHSDVAERDRDWLVFWFNPRDRLAFTLISPSGEELMRVDPSDPENHVKRSHFYAQMTYTRIHPDNGDSRLLITISQLVRGPLIPSGHWTLRVDAIDIRADGQVLGWLESNIGRPLRFDDSSACTSHTITIPGTARSVITVGACAARDPLEPGDFSSEGPTRDGRPHPTLVAPGTSVNAARSETPNGFYTAGGTSMSAPHVAGAIALALSRRHKLRSAQLPSRDAPAQWNAVQIKSALVNNLHTGNTPWDARVGFGSLNVEMLMRELE